MLTVMNAMTAHQSSMSSHSSATLAADIVDWGRRHRG
jgi:hypothetical protein